MQLGTQSYSRGGSRGCGLREGPRRRSRLASIASKLDNIFNEGQTGIYDIIYVLDTFWVISMEWYG